MDGPSESLLDTADREPWEHLDRLRAAGDAVWDEGLSAWATASYEACKFAQRNDETLWRVETSGAGLAATPGETYYGMTYDEWVTFSGGPRHLAYLTGDDHARVHRWWMRVLSPSVIETWRAERIRPVLDRLVDRLDGRRTVELDAELVAPMSVQVLAATLGLPWEDEEWLGRWREIGVAIRDFKDSTPDRALELLPGARRAAEELFELLTPFVRARRAGTGDDFISLLWRDGPSLFPDWGERDVLTLARAAVEGGTDTTRHGTMNALYLMLGDPALADQLRAGGEAAVARFVEESLRLFPPFVFRPRIATRDATLGGVAVKQGERILELAAAANRDPERYSCPHAVDLDRPSPRDHFAFHYGPRACVGQALARAELQETISIVLERLPGIEIDPTAPAPEYRGFVARSYRPLHARLAPAD
jgi:cytochrome P450